MKPKYFRLAVIALLAVGPTVAVAQVSEMTEEDMETIPRVFMDDVTGETTTIVYEAELEAFNKQAPPEGMYPKTGPRNFTGAYKWQPMFLPPVDSPTGTGAPGSICVPRFSNGLDSFYPAFMMVTPHQVNIVQEEMHFVRRVYIGAQHPKNLKPTHSGHSIGYWEGDTLVVDTIGVKGESNDGTVMDNVHLVEHFRKIKGGRQLERQATLVDTKTGEKTTSTAVAHWRPDLTFVEDICEEAGEIFGDGYIEQDGRFYRDKYNKAKDLLDDVPELESK